MIDFWMKSQGMLLPQPEPWNGHPNLGNSDDGDAELVLNILGDIFHPDRHGDIMHLRRWIPMDRVQLLRLALNGDEDARFSAIARVWVCVDECHVPLPRGRTWLINWGGWPTGGGISEYDLRGRRLSRQKPDPTARSTAATLSGRPGQIEDSRFLTPADSAVTVYWPMSSIGIE